MTPGTALVRVFIPLSKIFSKASVYVADVGLLQPSDVYLKVVVRTALDEVETTDLAPERFPKYPVHPQAVKANRNANITVKRPKRLAPRMIIFIPCYPLCSNFYSAIWLSLILRRLPGESTTELSTYYSLSRGSLKTL